VIAAVYATLLAICPVGTVDQVESGRMAVLGATGVHVVATNLVSGHPYDGARVELAPDGRCRVAPPDRELVARIEARLRALWR
jgi:hypothetical protein